ncbi:MAG: YHS domain-containing protein [Ignavibacteriales bacterium]|nr:MAG: YHS domain-containing protein [Ignavibacteriales bacterium]
MLLSLVLTISLTVINNAQDKKPVEKKTSATERTKEKTGCCGVEETAAVKSVPWNVVCPVLGNKVNLKVKTVEYDGKTYGFCCPGCDNEFQENPEKYLRNLSSDGKKFIKSKS